MVATMASAMGLTGQIWTIHANYKPGFVCSVIAVFTALPGIQAAFPSQDDGDQFTSNLFSDLAPLIALFGEQVSKQFISNSTSFAENIIFAMAPLGIITAVVSAIRVGGPRWLRGLVGRARESRGDIEVELMSSTSREVCELWRDGGLVRLKGSPYIAQLLFEKGDQSWNVYRLEERSAESLNTLTGQRSSFERSELGGELSVAPNLALNLVPQPSTFERWFIAVLGVALQCGVLVFGGIVTYQLRWLKSGVLVPNYAFPSTAAGTIAICTGMIICTYIIEASTSETRLPLKKKAQVAWIQRAQ